MVEIDKAFLDFIDQPRERCFVYRLPDRLTHGYCFDGGHPIAFQNVDWFDAPTNQPREQIEPFITKKPYYDPKRRFLVVSKHPAHTFTIEPVT